MLNCSDEKKRRRGSRRGELVQLGFRCSTSADDAFKSFCLAPSVSSRHFIHQLDRTVNMVPKLWRMESPMARSTASSK